MRVLAAVAVLGACAFDPRAPGELGDDVIQTIREDSAADFARGELVDLAVTPRGTLESHAFAPNGLRARAFATNCVTPTSTWADIEAAVAQKPKIGFSYGQVPTNWDNQRPRGLGLRDPFDDFTLLFEGEIELTAGTHALSVDADDDGFVEVDLGAGFANTVTDQAPPGAGTVELAVPADGWYPIRAAIGEDGGNVRLVLALDGTAITASQLRARVTDDHGLVVNAFERGHQPPLGATAVESVDAMFGRLPPPFDLPLTSTYDLRFVGQIFIDTAGTWTIAAKRLDPVDLMHLWIDGKRVASGYEDNITDGLPAAATLELGVGWHDLAVDLAAYQSLGNTNNNHDVGISLVATPPGGVEAPVTSAMLRPVVAAYVSTAFLSPGIVALPADQTTNVTMPVLDLPGATIDIVDAGYFLERANAADYTVVLDTGEATPIPMPSADPGMLANSALFAGKPLPAVPWTMRFTDTNIDGGPSDAFAFFVYLDFSCHGGPAMPFAPTTTYTSTALATPGATRIAAVRVAAALAGARAAVSLRAAATEAALADAAWVDVPDPAAPPALAGEFIQYRITTTGDGWQNFVIDTVEIDYAAAR